MTVGHKYSDGVAVVLSVCVFCGSEIILAFYSHHVVSEEYIKYLCSECGFETLIKIQEEWL